MIPCDTPRGTRVRCIDADYGAMPVGYNAEAFNSLPRFGREYTVREIVPANVGPCGVRLLEIQNPAFETYIGGKEPIFSLHRFEIVKEEIVNVRRY